MNFFKNHISFLVAVVILISSLFVASIFSVFNYYSIHEKNIQSSKKSIQQLIIIIKETAAIAAYLDNTEIAQEVVNGLVKNDLVSYAKLSSIKGLKQSAGKVPLQKQTQQDTFIQHHLVSPFIDTEIAGSLTIYPNYQFIHSNIKALFWNQTISLVVYTLFIAFFVFITINIALIRPLKKVTSRLNYLSPGNDERIQCPNGHKTDEIGGLTKDINALLQSMQSIFSSEHGLRIQSEKINKELNQANSIIKANQVQIEKSRAEAVDANKAKSDFLAGMSHEIRTPMTAIIGLTELLLKGDASQEQVSKLTKVQRASSSLLHIINDILDFSKIEAGKMNLEQVPFQLDEIINHLSALFKEPCIKRSNRLSLSIQEGCPCGLIGDPVRLEQVLMNLIGNANKFTQDGEIDVTISHSNDIDSEAVFTFIVKDSGIGIAKENLESLFSAFSQADMSITRKFGGTGLGLSISSKIVKKMGSYIKVESELNKGSVFSFQVNFQQQECNQGSQTELSSSTIESAYEQSLKLLDQKRILIVDDNVIIQEILSELLQGKGASVGIAENGQIAINELVLKQQSSKGYDLVLMDIQMPVLDGISACEIIRKTEHLKHIPLIAVTAHAQDEQRNKCLEVGFNDFIIKPYKEPELLKSIIKQLIRSSQMRVLLFEDNQINSEIFVDNINELSIVCDTAETIEQGIALYQQHAYQMIFMDLHLPDGSGVDAAITIRAMEEQPSKPDIPIIAFTASTTEEDKQKALDSGMNDILSKPFYIDQLQFLVVKWGMDIDSLSRATAEDLRQNNTVEKTDSLHQTEFNTVAENSPIATLDTLIEKKAKTEDKTSQLVETLDENILKSMQKKPKLFSRLIQIYLDTSTEHLSNILLFIEQQDTEQLRLTAHPFKSSSRQMAALSLGDKLEQVETEARNGHLSEDIQQLVKEIQSEYNLVIVELKQFKFLLDENG